MQKRILVIASITDIAPAKYLVKEFKKLGNEILVVSDQNYENVDVVDTKAVDIEGICKKRNFKPEVILFVEGGNMNLFPTNLESFQCLKLWWGIDTHNDYRKHLLISRLFDHSFIAQKDFVSILQKDGISSVSWFPLATPETDIEITASNRNLDISYVGSQNWQLYPERKALIDLIKKNYKNIFIGSASSNEMLEIYRDSKIVLNFSLKNDINMRVFEAIGSGALLLTNEIKGNGMNDLLESKKDYDTYSSSDDLIAKIDYYLNNENQRSEIANSGYERIIKSHKYSDRAKEILNYNPIKTFSHSVSIFDNGAVLSMFNFYPDAFNLFVKAARENKKGNRSKLLILVLQILALPVMLILKTLEKLLSKLK